MRFADNPDVRLMRHNFDHALDSKTRIAYARILNTLEVSLAHYKEHAHPILCLPDKTDDLATLQDIATRWQKQASRVVVIGTGGASLGGQAVVQFRGALSWWQQAQPQILFTDLADAADFAALLAAPLTTTRFLVISQSGETAETLIQAESVLASLTKAELNPADYVLAITQHSTPNRLVALADAHGIPILAHEAGICGRFSVLSNVGMLPALLAGADAAAIRRGAAQVVAALFATPLGDNAPLCGAALHLTHIQAGRNIAVLMPYTMRLERLTFWYRQLWAESLGKGGHGSLPANALGPIDQHSQLQLYCDGPDDKFYTFIIPPPQTHAYGRLLAASARAVGDGLVAAGRPVRVFSLTKMDDEALGALLMHFMLETIFTAAGLGIDPFDQPAIDGVKLRTRDYLAQTEQAL